ncbi:hypothetical protein [Caproiciproducens sp. CPB-2]|nr:hypothetical protein [Caproiciproducens sp. CPB-2]MDF1495190.1 hypothetical protein [Caproiciproducens sp. CPB-2]
MKIGEKDCDQVVVTSDSGEVIAVVSDKEIIEHDGYKVKLS